MMPDMMGGGAPAGPPGGGAPTGPPMPLPDGGPPQQGGDPVEMIRQALQLVDQATKAEPDDEDSVLLEKIQSDLQSYIANQQKLVDSATGAGPGAKLLRKSSGGSAPSGGY